MSNPRFSAPACTQSFGTIRSAGFALASRLSNYLFIGRTLDWDATLNTRVNALTVDQVNAAMRKHVDPSKLSVVKAGDFKKAITSSNNWESSRRAVSGLLHFGYSAAVP